MFEETVKHIGERISETRSRRNITAEQLATWSDSGSDDLRAVEAARRTVRSDELFRLASALDIPVKEFFGSPQEASV